MSTEIAVVIVNWNKKEDVLRLLENLQHIPESIDSFVVDNASTDGSIAAIQSEFPRVHVIRNPVNLGGTGGFNTGLKQVLNAAKYTYIWLLDNDAAIQADTLTELLKAMNTDPAIGIVGSRIIDIDNQAVTVETGGKIRWDIMTVEPLNRNSTTSYAEIIDADYVAVCSALVRTSALNRVGLMDSRFFIFWDDMDWGLYFKKYGYRVICATKSIVSHGSFTERDRGLQTGYYGIRNAFLVYTKHTPFLKRSKIFYRTLRYLSRIRSFLLIHRKDYEARLIQQAFSDYLQNRWGKLSLQPPQEQKPIPASISSTNLQKLANSEMVLVSTINISKDASNVLLETSEKLFPNSQITVLVHNDRVEYYKTYDRILVDRKKTGRVGYLLALYAMLKRKGFDTAVTMKPYPLLNAAKSVIWLDEDGKIESQTKTGWGYFIRLCAAFLTGEIIALYLFPIMLMRSLKYADRSG